jgi:hypothetical protein
MTFRKFLSTLQIIKVLLLRFGRFAKGYACFLLSVRIKISPKLQQMTFNLKKGLAFFKK